MDKVLGLDLGTNSIGWAIVEQDENQCKLIDKGVHIFQEGVAREKNNEKPAVQDRTAARGLRRHYFRRRLRKIELLKVLVKYDLCPQLTEKELDNWRKHKLYPRNEEFLKWQRTDDNTDKNPYHDRNLALNQELNLQSVSNRYILGRAIYHLAQRRGFLSNRKDSSSEDETGKVKASIKQLSSDMEAAGCKYIGEYFYRIYGNEQIRKHYTHRTEHYLAEFQAICKKQHLEDSLRKELERAIFFQRPLKSQKGLVGKCTFEKRKSRCSITHPRFEEFRMLQFINNIHILTPQDDEPRSLSQEEFLKIEDLFYRKSKPHFDFEEIAKRLAGKGGHYICKGDRTKDLNHAFYRFNYSRTTTVSGCPITAALMDIFGKKDYLSEICSVYTLAEGKSEEQILNDVWHALFSFDKEDLLIQWAKEKLQLSEEEAVKFAKIKIQQDYASLSLNAINKILPYLRRGLRYDEAVFLANLNQVLPKEITHDPERLEQVKQDIHIEMSSDFASHHTKERSIINYLKGIVGVDERHIQRLYHPSMIETYPSAQPNAQGILQLGSPRTSAVRNPMAMRALFRLRILINQLLRDGKIDPTTKINIEFARGLNDANKRKAIEQYQRNREQQHAKYAEEIKKLYKAESGVDIEPTEDEILKFQFWEEQKHICPYTGKTISITDFIGDSTTFDIEHTLPRSKGGDNSQMNKTLCENKFNREIKRTFLPTELANHNEIMERIESFGWITKVEELAKQIARLRIRSKAATTKGEKDSAIQRRHELEMEWDYWQGKLERFTMKEVPEGFSNRQGVDIGIIGRYARLYLKTLFDKIYTVKGATTAEFRKMWGLQPADTKKERINHIHHCVDAITIASIGAGTYAKWAEYTAKADNYRFDKGEKPKFDKPWATFTEDVLGIGKSLLVAHHTPDNMAKKGRKKLRIRGVVQTNAIDEPKYIQGDTARGVLHQQTFYGAIMRDEELKYVVRKSLDQIAKKDIKNIVDDVVRQKIQDAVDTYGESVLKDSNHPIWMNEQKGIQIKKVRLFTPSVTQPLHLKKQRDLSVKEYKQDYHVVNDSNYCMGIYEGEDAKGNLKHSFKILNKLEAAKHFNALHRGETTEELLPLSDSNDYTLKCILKVGTMVLFYENSPEELYEASKEELAKRLYKVAGMSTMLIRNQYLYGVLSFKHHQEARPAGELKQKNGLYKIGEDYRPIIGINHNQLTALIEGYDFEMSVTGEIKFKHSSLC